MTLPKAPFQSAIQGQSNLIVTVWQTWIDRLQNLVNAFTGSGVTAGRPTQNLYVGQPYFDTTLDQPVWWDGTQWLTVNSFITPVQRAYASMYDNTDQTAASTTVAYPVTFNTPNGAHNVVLESGSHIKVLVDGIFNIQFSFQFISTENNANNPHEVNIWFRKNGSDIAESNSIFTVPNRHGTHDGALIAALNFLVDLDANDYVEIIWQTENTNISMQTLPAGTTPTTPVTPSAILTVQQI